MDSLPQRLFTLATKYPNDAALLCHTTTNEIADVQQWITWLDLATAVSNTARWLEKKGLKRGSIVASYLPNSWKWISLDLACLTLGIAHAPIDTRLPKTVVEGLCQLCMPELLITDKACEKESLDLPPPCVTAVFSWLDRNVERIGNLIDCQILQSPKPASLDLLNQSAHLDDVANILFTSGTTGKPKGVMLTQCNLVSNAWGKLTAMPQYAYDIRLNFLPFSHSYARTCELTTWLLTGGRLALAPTVHQMRNWCQAIKPTVINGVPAYFERICREMSGDSSIRFCDVREYFGGAIRQLACGGAALTSDTEKFFRDNGLPILVGYGLTEASPVVCSNITGMEGQHDVGPPIPGVQLRLTVDSELLVKGPGIMKGYVNDPEATAEVLQDGYLATGDLAQQLPNGAIRLLGRKRDTLILSTGVKLHPYSLESQLKSCPGVEDALLVGDGWERCAAIVVISTKLMRQLKQQASEITSLLWDSIESQFSNFPRYAIPGALILRQQPFAADPEFVNFKGQPRREIIRLRYSDSLIQLLNSGDRSVLIEE